MQFGAYVSSLSVERGLFRLCRSCHAVTCFPVFLIYHVQRCVLRFEGGWEQSRKGGGGEREKVVLVRACWAGR